VIEEEHDRLVFVLFDGGQVEAVGDLNLGVAQPFRQGREGGGTDDVAALDRDEFPGRDRGDGDEPPALDRTDGALARFGGDVTGNKHGLGCLYTIRER
jgi:hypothetical protein